MVKIKICGIRRMEDINIVNKYKPDYIGFVFAKSKRQISPDTAQNLKQKLNPEITSVGVFVDESEQEILNLFKNKIIDIAQLHGRESEEFIMNLKDKTDNKLKIIKAVEITNESNFKNYKTNADYLLLDNGKGSGKTFNWNLVEKNFANKIFLAGGLNRDNIIQAIDEFKPYAVDLSSSLEVNGFKDENKIKEIMEIIK